MKVGGARNPTGGPVAGWTGRLEGMFCETNGRDDATLGALVTGTIGKVAEAAIMPNGQGSLMNDDESSCASETSSKVVIGPLLVHKTS